MKKKTPLAKMDQLFKEELCRQYYCGRCYGTEESGHQEACPMKPITKEGVAPQFDSVRSRRNFVQEEMDQLIKDIKEKRLNLVPKNAKERKNLPVTSGVIDYFPRALQQVAHVSVVGNQQHNPGEPLHWAKNKSTDHADCILRHIIDRGKIDDDGVRHSAKLAWRALALLEIELEEAPLREAEGEVPK